MKETTEKMIIASCIFIASCILTAIKFSIIGGIIYLAYWLIKNNLL